MYMPFLFSVLISRNIWFGGKAIKCQIEIFMNLPSTGVPYIYIMYLWGVW